MTERLVITALAHRGDGVADTPAGPIYVAGALPGETVTVTPAPGEADRRLLSGIEIASPRRIVPVCQHFGVCGGCVVQHFAADGVADWKRAMVATALAHHHIDAPVDAVIDAHGKGRRRATFHARGIGGGRLDVGFAAARAHTIVPIAECPVLAPAMSGALAAARAIAETLEGARKPLDIQVTATEAGLDIDVRGSGPLNAARTSSLARLAEARRLARITRHGDVILQSGVPTLTMGRARVALPAGCFLQATEAGEATLAKLVLEHVADAKTAADLFCGVGPFALRLAERTRIVAADSDAEAVAALKQAANMTPGLKPIAAEARDLFRRPFTGTELKRTEAVVFDPPRQGAEAQARELAASKVPLIVAVSCNPATFARDARILIDGGYKLVSVTPVDQFRYSSHVELVARFER